MKQNVSSMDELRNRAEGAVVTVYIQPPGGLCIRKQVSFMNGTWTIQHLLNSGFGGISSDYREFDFLRTTVCRALARDILYYEGDEEDFVGI